jgi:DNA invertase Pin-like site-specific DNA recombinase
MERGIIGYYRVSSDGQAEHGFSVDAQRDLVHAYAAQRGVPVLEEFTEIESAYKPSRLTLTRRPELRNALARCKRHRATLVIAALDRLARNVVFIASLVETRISFVALDIPNATPFMLHIYAAVAEEESRQKGEVTKAAIALSRAQGTVWGRNLVEQSKRLRRRSERLRHLIDEIRGSGITGTTLIARELNERNIPCLSGKIWTSQSARTLLRHLGYYDMPAGHWFEYRREQARVRLETVAEAARALCDPGTAWKANLAERLDQQRIRTGDGLRWDKVRVDGALKSARKLGLWS